MCHASEPGARTSPSRKSRAVTFGQTTASYRGVAFSTSSKRKRFEELADVRATRRLFAKLKTASRLSNSRPRWGTVLYCWTAATRVLQEFPSPRNSRAAREQMSEALFMRYFTRAARYPETLPVHAEFPRRSVSDDSFNRHGEIV